MNPDSQQLGERDPLEVLAETPRRIQRYSSELGSWRRNYETWAATGTSLSLLR
jgi:hypothetical protein